MIERRELRPTNVLIAIVPGHEIAGVVSAVGSEVRKFRPGDRAGVGCLVNSCRTCDACRAGEEQYCDEDVLTYNAVDRDGSRTYGGYSEKIVVDEAFVVHIPEEIPLERAAPMMCAASPSTRRCSTGGSIRASAWPSSASGGVGHMGVQISAALGAYTVALDVAPDKRDDALRLGADEIPPDHGRGHLP